ncbi:hypothetical protein BDZ88DRAFT_318803 [Geranomyces variabilis]|nr:hypothetical protein BDZ88DRAFT_318803 [Geranomyces variabilis]
MTKMRLSVTVVSLERLKDADSTGNGDVYVRLSTDKTTWQATTVKLGADHQALVEFDEKFQFEVDPDPQLYIEVYDKDPANDSLLGSNHVDLAPIGESQEVNVTLKKHVVHRHAGIVKMRVGFE